MNKKPLQKIVQHPTYNQTLFTSAIAIAQSCQNLLSNVDSLDSSQKILLTDKQHLLQVAIKNAISTFGKFCDIHKAPLATPLDHSIDIFEAISDNIETSVQKYRQNSKNGKLQTGKTQKIIQQLQRPQDKYDFIKPAHFQFHSHEKDLSHIRTDINVIRSRPIQEKLVYVDTEQKLQKMISELVIEPEIAVDVEHSSKSYQGFTCLIQISSRSKDYIIDVFPIWPSVSLLKRVMENPTIIKVMHGAQMDTKWLQRDFNVHIHNLFDTYRGSRTLGLPKLSYAFLLNHYCNATTDKTFQTADWRQRPLSEQMLHYARLDTHYLLQIFDWMRADIQQKAISMGLNPSDVLTDVYSVSHQVTKTEVQMFNHLKKQSLQQLRKEHKDNQYQLFQGIFGKLNQIAKQNDVAYDQIVTHKFQRLIISKLRELLYVRSQQVSIKIDNLILELGHNESKIYLKAHFVQIKQYLQLYFQKRALSKKKQVKSQKAKITHIEQQIFSKEDKKKAQSFNIVLKEYATKTYQNMNFNPFSMLTFQPITGFLAKKLGVSTKNQEEGPQQQEIDVEMQNQQDQQQSHQQKAESNQQAIIQFKRINPNVIYTIEEAEVVEEKHKPRKKRKQHQYEKKIRQKSGNIYQLLQQ